MPVLDINGKTLRFGAAGTGSTVVALHSSASNGGQWKSLMEHLQGRHCVFTPDLAGYGGSDPWPGGPDQSLSHEAAFIFHMIERWEEPVHLVGHSMGGAVALQIALQHPEWVRSLTLIEPTVFHLLRDGNADDAKLFAEVEALRGQLNAAAALGNPNAGMQQFIDYWNGNGAWSRTAPLMKAHLADQLAQVINNFAAGDAETWLVESCAALNCPTMALMGTESPKPVQRITDLLVEAMPGSRLHVVPGAGHMVPLTDPHIVDPLIAGHIRAAEIAEASWGYAAADLKAA